MKNRTIGIVIGIPIGILLVVIAVCVTYHKDSDTNPYTTALDYIWFRESSNGTNPLADGNEYQITQIFIDDVWQRWGYKIDVSDNESCRKGIVMWLDYYAPLAGIEPHETEELYRLYNLGPTGYKEQRQ